MLPFLTILIVFCLLLAYHIKNGVKNNTRRKIKAVLRCSLLVCVLFLLWTFSVAAAEPIEEEPKVAAIGAGMDIFQPSGNMVVDIGGGTTDVAVLSMGDIVTSESIKVAGDVFDNDILQYIKKEYKLLIGERTAESIKIAIGTVFPEGRNEEMDIRGRDMVTGLPRTITIRSEEVERALRESVSVIVQAAKNVLEKTPPELSADIIDRGVIITGGGALLHGMDHLLMEELKVPVFVAENPMDCVAVGTGIMLDNIDKIRRR